eukprot:Phypoly_transcript_13526.p1 GENE.Phypoly_transcript_13526~~Phypoly_transcript_13526.p1  ORF type:complete len:299 (+),score=68.71 Phypoly_transcript_13526:150-1046(+)
MAHEEPNTKTLTAAEEKAAGNAAFVKGQNKQALEHYTNAIQLDPDNLLYYNNRAATYLRLGSYAEALADAEKAIALFEASAQGTEADAAHGAKAHYRRGECFAGMGQYADAVGAYEKGLKVEPTNSDIEAARDTAQLALRHPELMSKLVGPKSDRNSLLHLRQVGEAVRHNLRVLREQPFAKDVTYMTQRLPGKLRCIQYVLVDSAARITSTNGSNSLQSAGVAEKLAEGKVVVCHMFVHVDITTHAQEYLCESGEESNRFKGKPWNSFQQNVLLITVKEASKVGVFNEFIPKLLFNK